MQIDHEKTGQVKSDVFKSILALHSVILSNESFSRLQRLCSEAGVFDSVKYREALQRLTINQDIDEPLMKEWVVRLDREANAYTAMGSSIRSMSQTKSMMSKTNAFMR